MSEVDWGRYNLPAIRSLISDVDVCAGADRVLAWEGLATTVRDQHQRLLQAADHLAAVWPPGDNDSALEFQRQVKGLADSMQETLTRAEDTRAGLNGVIQAFSTAQQRVRDLAAGREGVSNDWMPRFIDHAEDKYDEQAQSAMRAAEAAISDHTTQIKPPSLFQMRTGIGDDGHHLTDGESNGSQPASAGGDSRSGLRATPVPVPVEKDPAGVSPDSPARFGSGGAGGTDPSGSGQGSGAAGFSDGPVLSGLTPASQPGTGISAPLIGGAPSTGIGGLLPNSPGGNSPLPPGTVPFGGGLPGGVGAFGGGLISGPSAPGSGPRRPVPIRRAMPSGAVIGESAGRNAGAGSGGAGAVPTGGGGRGAGRRASDGVIDGQVDQVWATDEGVAPVIKPETSDVRHDPGPGVIGLDR